MKNYFGLLIILGIILAGCRPGPPPEVLVQTSDQPTTTEIKTEQQNLVVKVPILIYHHVRQQKIDDDPPNQTFIVSPQNFQEQLQYLKDNGFTTISFQNLIDFFNGNFNLPPKPVIISFDDGVINQYNNAFGLLKSFGFKATFFVFTNPIGRSKNYLSWEQLKEMIDAGMEIGSHGYYHQYFTKANNEELTREISGSKKILEENLGIKINVISYPFGVYNEQITQTIKNAGYLAARDIVNGVDHTKEDLFKLKSYFITNDFERFKSIVNKINK